ncbi:MAG TPA: acyl-CoA dehydrogenase family protein, partial [Thermoplasmata archaeon]|nr:acyl-CoA dehydrogenase family protein [Thermoplasmata archaeon]
MLPHAARIDRDDRIPPEIHARLRSSGLMGLTIPEEYGGAGASARSIAAVLEEVSRASAAVATLLSVHLSVAAAPIVEWGTPEQRKRFLPAMARGEWLGAFALSEPSVGSDAARLATRYRSDGGGFRLNGSKMFITNGASAKVLVLFATRDPAEGAHGISAFLLTQGTPGFSVAQHLDKLGLRGSETTEVVLEEARLPGDALLGEEGSGLKVA